MMTCVQAVPMRIVIPPARIPEESGAVIRRDLRWWRRATDVPTLIGNQNTMEEQESTRMYSEESLEINIVPKNLITRSFRRMYTGAAIILTVFCLPAFMVEVLAGKLTVIATVMFLLATVPLVPLFQRGGFLIYIRITISLAVLISALFGILIGMEAYDILNHGPVEGPRGEGAPIYSIIVLEFAGLLLFAPWFLTAIRGIPLWHTNTQAEQAVPSDGHKPSGHGSSVDPTAPADAH